MPKQDLYYVYGNDVEMIEKKFLPDLEKKYQKAALLRFDATIDDIPATKLVSEYLTNDLFHQGKVIIIRNADHKPDPVEALLSALIQHPIEGNALVLLAEGLNKTTRLGKLVKDNCLVKEFDAPEIKPFDLLDAINSKSGGKALHQANRLFGADYHPLALFSLLCGHFFLMKKVKKLQHLDVEDIARELKEHQFRIKKMSVANRYWSMDEINGALKGLSELGDLLRTWRYDEKVLLQMFLIKITL